MASFVVFEQDKKSHRFIIEKNEILIGRKPENDFLVPHLMVSGQHARLTKQNDQYVLTDLNSTNGTFVNGVRIAQPVTLNHKDHVNFGAVDLVFLLDDNATVEFDKSILAQQPQVTVPPKKTSSTGFTSEISPNEVGGKLTTLKTSILAGQADRNAIATQFLEIEHLVQVLQNQLKESEKYQEKLNVLYEVGKVINHILEQDELLKTIIDLALKVMNADCGFLMLYNEKGELLPTISRKMEADEFSSNTVTFSMTISRRVAESGQSVLTSDAQNDERFQSGASIISHHIRSVICSPLKNKDQKTVGVIYVGSNVMSNVFSTGDVDLLEAFGNHAAIAIENAKLYEERRRKEHLKSALQRYVSKQIAERIMSDDGTGSIRFMPERREVTLIFTDIRGFTTLSENMEAEEMAEILNRYFTRMIDIIFKYGGTLDKFIGDSIMAIFGAPASTGNDPMNAVNAAIDMQKEIVAFNEEQKRLNKVPIEVGIGINTGHVVVGNIGSEKRLEYTAIGDNVNLASRLQGQAAGGKIIISKATFDAVKDKIKATKLDTIKVKGKAKPVEIYDLSY